MKRTLFVLFFFFTLSLSRALFVDSYASMEIDAQGIVTKVVDGDTLDVSNFGRIRLADINTPESDEAGYYEAKNYLSSLVYNAFVYIDKDEKLDPYERFVCVIYVRWNTTHLLNVNKALLLKGVAKISNYPNEFNPASWNLYIYSPTSRGGSGGGSNGGGTNDEGGNGDGGGSNGIPSELLLLVIALLGILLLMIILDALDK